MYRNTANRAVQKYVDALLVYCNRSELDKATVQLENLYQALDDLIEATKERIALSEKRKEKVKDVRPEAKRQTSSTGSDKKVGKGKAKAGKAGVKVPSSHTNTKS